MAFDNHKKMKAQFIRTLKRGLQGTFLFSRIKDIVRLSFVGSGRTIQRILKRLANKAHINRPVTPHVLRHYLPFLTMSGNLSASTDVAGLYRLQGLDRLTVARHSFLVPTDRCSGWSQG